MTDQIQAGDAVVVLIERQHRLVKVIAVSGDVIIVKSPFVKWRAVERFDRGEVVLAGRYRRTWFGLEVFEPLNDKQGLPMPKDV